MKYKVKKLDWKKRSNKEWKASTPFGYFVVQGSGFEFCAELFDKYGSYINGEGANSEKEAKSWCQKYLSRDIKKIMKYVEVLDGVL